MMFSVVLHHYNAAEKLLVLLRDGRKLLGILRSFDQFGMNFLLSLFHFHIL
jgi:small nuclear ribonucleoprotein (snRNP)-like protein